MLISPHYKSFFRLLLPICGSVLLLLFSSCKKDLSTLIGSNLQPEDEFLDALFNDTDESLKLIAYSVREDSAVTSGLTHYSLGSYKHPDFGTITADIISQVYEANVYDSVKEFAHVDSVVLKLICSSAYPAEGMKTKEISISIGELSQAVTIDSTAAKYYNTQTREHDQSYQVQPLFRFFPKLTDSITDPDDSTSKLHDPVIDIPLSLDYGRKLLETSSQNLEINDFLRKVKGLYLKTLPETADGQGSMAEFNFSGTDGMAYVAVYYHKTASDTVSTLKRYDLKFSGGMTYNYVTTDRSGASSEFTQQLAGDTTSIHENVFLQAFFGSTLRVKMPDIRNFKQIAEGKQIVINQACLVMSVDENYGRFTPPASLNIVRRMAADTVMNLLDHSTFVGGTFDETKSEYRFYITQHIQNLLLNDSAENFPLMIYARNTRFTKPELAIIKGVAASNAEKRMRLEIIYTVLPVP